MRDLNRAAVEKWVCRLRTLPDNAVIDDAGNPIYKIGDAETVGAARGAVEPRKRKLPLERPLRGARLSAQRLRRLRSVRSQRERDMHGGKKTPQMQEQVSGHSPSIAGHFKLRVSITGSKTCLCFRGSS